MSSATRHAVSGWRPCRPPVRVAARGSAARCYAAGSPTPTVLVHGDHSVALTCQARLQKPSHADAVCTRVHLLAISRSAAVTERCRMARLLNSARQRFEDGRRVIRAASSAPAHSRTAPTPITAGRRSADYWRRKPGWRRDGLARSGESQSIHRPDRCIADALLTCPVAAPRLHAVSCQSLRQCDQRERQWPE